MVSPRKSSERQEVTPTLAMIPKLTESSTPCSMLSCFPLLPPTALPRSSSPSSTPAASSSAQRSPQPNANPSLTRRVAIASNLPFSSNHSRNEALMSASTELGSSLLLPSSESELTCPSCLNHSLSCSSRIFPPTQTAASTQIRATAPNRIPFGPKPIGDVYWNLYWLVSLYRLQ